MYSPYSPTKQNMEVRMGINNKDINSLYIKTKKYKKIIYGTRILIDYR